MSNSTRIWVGYALIGLPPLLLWTGAAAPAVAYLEQHYPSLLPYILLAVFCTWGASLFIYSAWARCWRCDESLSRNSKGYSPIVLRTSCVKCGVKHSAKPER